MSSAAHPPPAPSGRRRHTTPPQRQPCGRGGPCLSRRRRFPRPRGSQGRRRPPPAAWPARRPVLREGRTTYSMGRPPLPSSDATPAWDVLPTHHLIPHLHERKVAARPAAPWHGDRMAVALRLAAPACTTRGGRGASSHGLVLLLAVRPEHGALLVARHDCRGGAGGRALEVAAAAGACPTCP